MKDCTCGKAVRLRAQNITADRKAGVNHWIEHTDGSAVCIDGYWQSVELKPYGSPSHSTLLVERWNAVPRT